jgi:hypothetical protein
MLDDLTMIATLPVLDHESKAGTEADKAAAAETLPPAKNKRASKPAESKAARIARRGQDPPAPEDAGGKHS